MTLASIGLAALGGGAAGLVSGFLTAVLVLALKRARNRALVRRGEPAVKDVVLLPFYLPGGVLGAVTAAAAVTWTGLSVAIVTGALAWPVFYFIVAGIAFVTSR